MKTLKTRFQSTHVAYIALAMTLASCGTAVTVENTPESVTPTLMLQATGVKYSIPEAAKASGRSAWMGGRSAWMGGRSAWMGGDPSITLNENQSAWDQIGLPKAQQMAPNLGAGVTVAVIDTGIDLNHPAFQGRLAPAADWKDFVDGDATPQEVGTWGVDAGYGHGTAVAGIILQVAPKAKILPIRVLGPDGSGDTLNVADAIKYAVSKGVKVINISLGTVGFDCNIQKALALSVPDDTVVVASAGNSGDINETFPGLTSHQNPNAQYAKNPTMLAAVKACGINPGQSAQVNIRSVGVGSVSTVNLDKKSDFSTYGSGLEMLAPGENIQTVAPEGATASWSGTSFATPMVSGGLALAMGQKLSNSVNPTRLGVYVANSSTKIDTANPTLVGYLGFGRLNLVNFLTKVLTP